FDEISIIEPGKKDEPEEENAEEQSPEEEDNPKEKEEETLAGVEPAEEKTEEKESAESAPAEETVEQAPAETSEIVHPEIIDENLNLQAPREVSVPPEDKVVTPEEEKPAEETEYKSEFKDSEFAEQQQLSDETAPGTKPEASVHEEAPEDKRDFSDAEGLVSSGDTSINREEKNIEEAGAEPKETAEKPAEDQGYEVIKPVKLKYDWKEGYLKESEESPVPDEHEEEENMEQEMPDDEGYIEIKPDASKEKIDFLADNEEEEQQVVKEEAAIPAEDQAQKDLKEYISKIEEIDKQTSHKRRNTTILAVIIFLLFVGIGVFLYYQYIFKKNNPAPVKSMTVVVKNAKTINRDFEIPVTYPYNKNENKGALYTQPIDSSIIAASQPPSNKVTTPPGSKTQNTVVQQEPPKLESMGGYIFKQGDDYIVQVSSFETQTRAETQAESWKKAHYDAFVRLDKRPNKTYYCVMIRGFKSYDEAKHFLK
ncbi:MAG TPA: SPOR domain-containing protein, partial [Ignavibacteriaceae bacterium]|nr:SPOR domain-containing protein [Ignavibacteriaceae bacterium]